MKSTAIDDRVGVMQLVDTLDTGGAERVAVNLANLVPRDRFRSFLCTTRRDGELSSLINADVGRLSLGRRWRWDLKAVAILADFVRSKGIRVLHAHGSTLLVARLASGLPPHPSVIWHDHIGQYGIAGRSRIAYRVLTKGIDGVIIVTRERAGWLSERLKVSPERIHYIPNFTCEPDEVAGPPELPGAPGSRVVCVANLRQPKDHATLVRAMSTVVRAVPSVHLLLVGRRGDHAYATALEDQVKMTDLGGNITFLGSRSDIAAVLRACDVGVLSSTSEGFPLSLVEYGMAGLAAVATEVGQCAEILDSGEAGVIVPPGCPDLLADALVGLLRSPARRADLGERLRLRVRHEYSAAAAMRQVCDTYEQIVGASCRRAHRARP